jgi:hypothetical protein
MGEQRARRHRVLIEDARRNGHHLRATWHPETCQFVVSTWNDDVCTGATRLAVDDVSELTGLLVDGLAEAASARRDAARRAVGGPPSAGGLSGFVARLRWLVRGSSPEVRPAEPEGARRDLAPVKPLRRDTA